MEDKEQKDPEFDKLMKKLQDHFYPTKDESNDVSVQEFLEVFGLGSVPIDHYQTEGSNYVKKEKSQDRKDSVT